MKHTHILPVRSPWHGLGCQCGGPGCRPRGPADPWLGPLQLASIIAIGGLVTALVLIEIYALVAKVPGVEVVFQ